MSSRSVRACSSASRSIAAATSPPARADRPPRNPPAPRPIPGACAPRRARAPPAVSRAPRDPPAKALRAPTQIKGRHVRLHARQTLPGQRQPQPHKRERDRQFVHLLPPDAHFQLAEAAMPFEARTRWRHCESRYRIRCSTCRDTRRCAFRIPAATHHDFRGGRGVGARRSATKSTIVKSVSCPTPVITGMPDATIARATASPR